MRRSLSEAPPSSSRRRFLPTAGATVGALPVVAGCTGRSGGERSTPAVTASPTAEESTATADSTSEKTSSPTPNGARAFAGHPAGRRLDAQPRLGPDPSEATAVVVAFEDPSCPRCAAFERETVPKTRSELVDEEVGAFVFRGYPIAYPWGKPATHLLSTFWLADGMRGGEIGGCPVELE
ncbi:MAG: thioredoxin domain-containing protein [Haloferacaceae archaeon]